MQSCRERGHPSLLASKPGPARLVAHPTGRLCCQEGGFSLRFCEIDYFSSNTLSCPGRGQNSFSLKTRSQRRKFPCLRGECIPGCFERQIFLPNISLKIPYSWWVRHYCSNAWPCMQLWAATFVSRWLISQGKTTKNNKIKSKCIQLFPLASSFDVRSPVSIQYKRVRKLCTAGTLKEA